MDGDKVASSFTRQDKVKAGAVMPEMQRRYAEEIRLAKLDEFKSYLDNGASQLADKRRLPRDVNFLTGRWVLTVKLEKMVVTFPSSRRDGFAGDSRTSMPGSSRPTVLLLLAREKLVAQRAANNYWDLFHLDLKTAFLQGEHYNLESRSAIIQQRHDIGLPPCGWLESAFDRFMG